MSWIRTVGATLLLGWARAGALWSQAPPPGTDIFLVSLASRGGRLELGTPRNLTARAGYDNQPAFAPDGHALYYTSIRDDRQADIYRLDLRSGRAARFTDTPESEYSPTVMPGGRELAVVRVERDSTQRLWAFALRGGGQDGQGGREPRLLLERVKPVGYQAWADDHTVLLYVLGSPATLRLADTRTGEARVLASDVGRSLHRVPGRRALSYLQRVSETDWWIRELDLATGASTPLVKALAGSQDYAWTPDGSVLMGQKNRLFRWKPGRDRDWVEAAALSEPGLQKLGRLAVSPDGKWLALVSEEAR